MEKCVAILIDGDNISAKYAEYIKQEAASYGSVRICRLYGSVTSPSVRSWYTVMPLQGIVPMLQISYANGKSIADQAITIDAMDLLYSGEIDTFCIVSSDCDFTKLVYRLKEAGKVVIGMGEKKTKEALAKACDEFKILDLIYKDAKAEKEDVENKDNNQVIIDTSMKETEEEIVKEEEFVESEISIPTEEKIINSVVDFIDSYDDNRVNLAEIGKMLKERYLGFDARNYGHRNTTKMIECHQDVLKVTRELAQDGVHSVIYVSGK